MNTTNTKTRRSAKPAAIKPQEVDQVEVTIESDLGQENNTQVQLQLLLEALKAAKKGDFTVRLSTKERGLEEIAQVFNEWMSVNQQFANEITQVSNLVGEEGKLDKRISIKAAGWATSIDAINKMLDGMPGYVANAGLADEVLPLEQIGGEIIRRIKEN